MLEMPDSIFFPIVSWLLNYGLHSTMLIGLALLVAKLIPANSSKAREVLLTLAILGGIVTATIQLETNPTGNVIRREAVKPAASVVVDEPATGAERGEFETVPPAVSEPRYAQGALVKRGTPWVEMLTFCWLAGVVILGAVYLAKWRFFLANLEDRRTLKSGPLFELLEEIKQRAGIRREIIPSISRRTSDLMAIGFSEICLPERLINDLEEDELRSILAHELAHLWRFDPLRLIVMSVINILFFFQPLNLLAARKLRAEAEYLADEWAIQQTGKPASMASSLLKAAVAQKPCRLAPATAGMAGNGASLVDRTKRILDSAPGKESAFPRILTAAAIAALLAVIAFAPQMADRLITDPNSEVFLRFESHENRVAAISANLESPPTPADFPKPTVFATSEDDSSNRIFEILGIDKESGTHCSPLTMSGHVHGVGVEADVRNVMFDTRKDWIYRFSERRGFLLVSYRKDGIRYRFEVYKSRIGGIDRQFYVDDVEREFDENTELLLKRALLELLYLDKGPKKSSRPQP